MGSHLIDGEFQSDKYPTTPRGKVPLSVKDPMAADLLWEYAQRRRAVDAEFSADLEAALRAAGYVPPTPCAWIVDDDSGEGWYTTFTAHDDPSEASAAALADIGQTEAGIAAEGYELLIVRAAAFDRGAAESMSEEMVNAIGADLLRAARLTIANTTTEAPRGA
jgi:hypothetical protein